MSVGFPEIKAFAGICKLRNGILTSPTVYSLSLIGKDKRPKYHVWSISIELMLDNAHVPITAALIKKPQLPSGYTAKYWTVSGTEDGRQTTSKTTQVNSGKNIGRSNETTVLTQALSDARSAYNFKLRKGGAIDKNALRLPGTLSFSDLLEDKTKKNPWRVFGMALHDVNKSDNWRHITYPGFIQPKYDGTRYIVVADPRIPGGIDAYSRGREDYEGQEHIKSELLGVLNKYPALYIDGELWREGYGLQQVSGSSRRQTGADKLDYYIFDAFYLDRSMLYTERRELVKEIQALIDGRAGFEHIKFAPSLEYKTKEEALHYYGEYLNAGYEGGVLRNKDSLYEWDVNREKRSYTTLKLKPMDDDDWPLVGITQGTNGKDVGALIWVLETTQPIIDALNTKRNLKAHLLPKPEDNRFNAVPKGMTYEQRYAAYAYLTTHPEYLEKLKNQLMRVQFSIISDYGKPQQPKVLGFRDLELNKEFISNL